MNKRISEELIQIVSGRRKTEAVILRSPHATSRHLWSFMSCVGGIIDDFGGESYEKLHVTFPNYKGELRASARRWCSKVGSILWRRKDARQILASNVFSTQQIFLPTVVKCHTTDTKPQIAYTLNNSGVRVVSDCSYRKLFSDKFTRIGVFFVKCRDGLQFLK